jgi:large subunit ribosomal protein L24e
MVKCIFCGREEREFRGIHLFKNDGSIAYFCSHKCRMNSLKLGRDKRRVRWTEAYRIARAEAEEKKKVSAKKHEEHYAEKPVEKKGKKK